MSENQSENLNPVLSRMLHYLRFKEIAPTKADDLMGSGNGRLGKMVKNNTTPRNTFIENFLLKFPDVSNSWLIDGQGEMLKENSVVPKLQAIPLHISADPHDFDFDGSRFEELPDGTLRMRIPIIPHRAFAGYLRGFKDPEYYEDLTYISIDVFKQHRGHYLAFEVKGDSMTTLEPGLFRKSIFDGVKVVGRELQKHQWQYKLHTHNYEAWVIVHKTEGILIKQIIEQDVENGTITIHSLNPDKVTYPDQTLHLDDIEQIFNVVRKIDE